MVDVGEAVGILAAQSIGEPGTQLTLRTFHIGGTAARIAEVTARKSQARGHRRVRRPPAVRGVRGRGRHAQDRHQARRRAGPARRGRPGAVALPGAARRRPAASPTARQVKKERPAVHLGPVHDADHHRRHGHHPLPRHRRGRDDPRGAGRAHRPAPAGHHRGPREEAAPAHRDRAGEGRQGPQGPRLRRARGRAAAGGRRRRRSAPARRSPRSAARPTRRATSRAACRGWPSCSRRGAPRTRPRSPRSTAWCGSARSSAASARSSCSRSASLKDGSVVTDDAAEPVLYEVPAGKHLRVHEGDRVRAGDRLTEGPVNPHDILRINGPRAVQEYLLNEVQEVYRLQGVKINDKHIGVIVKQMLQKLRIMDPGETEFLEGEHADKNVFRDENARIVRKGGTAAIERAAAPRHHQGEPDDAVVHLGRELPGDDARADRRRHPRGQGRPARPEGEHHHRAPDPRGHRHLPVPGDRRRRRRRASSLRRRRPSRWWRSGSRRCRRASRWRSCWRNRSTGR